MERMGERIRRLRESLDVSRAEKSQTRIATRAGRPGRAGQVWLSRIEVEREPTVDEAIDIIEALGPYAAGFLVLPREMRPLLRALDDAPPEDVGLALRLLTLLPELDDRARAMIEGMLGETAIAREQTR